MRFMDDILVLAPSRWKLRHVVRTVNQALASLAVEKHPDKTFIGRIERGFDFLGYHFSRVGLTIARKTIANSITKASRHNVQKRSRVLADAALEMYVKRWTRWASSGLGNSPRLWESDQKNPVVNSNPFSISNSSVTINYRLAKILIDFS
jgi:RNA-directed DNA polymerase